MKAGLWTWGCVFVLSLVTSCQDRDESLAKSFLKRPASGVVAGKAFHYTYAYIDPTAKTPNPDDFAFILLDYQPEDPCPRSHAIPAEAVTVTISAPKKKRKRPLTLKGGTARSLVMQWRDGKEPQTVIADRGKFFIYAMTAESVQAKVRARRDSDHWINGNFTAEVCAYRDMLE